MDSYADKDQDDTSEDDWHKPSEAVGGGGVGCFPQQGHLLSVLINVTTQLHANGCTNVHSNFTHWMDPSSPRRGVCNGYRHTTQPYNVTTHLFGLTAYITHHLICGWAISATHQPQVSSQRSHLRDSLVTGLLSVTRGFRSCRRMPQVIPPCLVWVRSPTSHMTYLW